MEKKTNIENMVFQSKQYLSTTDLNQSYKPSNEYIKYLIKRMYEEFKYFIDENYDVSEGFYKENIIITNKISFIPESVFQEKINKEKKSTNKDEG